MLNLPEVQCPRPLGGNGNTYLSPTADAQQTKDPSLFPRARSQPPRDSSAAEKAREPWSQTDRDHKLFPVSEPQFPQPYSGDNETYLTGFSEDSIRKTALRAAPPSVRGT